MKTLLNLQDDELKEIAGGLNNLPCLEVFLEKLTADIFGTSKIATNIDAILADIFGTGGGTLDSKTTL